MSATRTYELFFTGKDDPRSCIIIGEDSAGAPLFLAFDTPHGIPATRTTVHRNNKDLVALFDWNPGNHLGRVTIGSRTMPMSRLVHPSSSPNARLFESADSQQYEWRQCYDDRYSYDLYAAPNKRIALFRRVAQMTPVGPSHGFLQYTFNHELLLLEALLALSLNRWIDQYGM